MTSSIIIPINHIERKPNSDQYRVVSKWVTVEFLSRLIDNVEWPVDRICQAYGLTPAEVYSAWAFYYDHKQEIDQHVEEAAARHIEAVSTDKARYERVQERYRAKTGKSYPDER